MRQPSGSARRLKAIAAPAADRALDPPWPPQAICLNAADGPDAHSATTYPSSAALSGFGFAYRYAWRFS